MIERLKWWIAYRLDRLPGQCWANLVSWVLDSRHISPDLRDRMPWRPIDASCRKDAAATGRCYCGKIGGDGTTLRHGESVCSVLMSGRRDIVCSRPDGHDGMHRYGGVEWDRA